MATVTGLTVDKLNEELGKMVVFSSVDESGQISLKLKNGSIIPGGSFYDAIREMVALMVKLEVNEKVAGTPVNLGNKSGAITELASKTEGKLLNSMVTVVATGNLTIAAANLPNDATAGTQFAMRITQDGVGNRTLTTTNIKRTQGVLTLSTAPNAVDIVVFLYDGNSWYAGMMGVDFR